MRISKIQISATACDRYIRKLFIYFIAMAGVIGSPLVADASPGITEFALPAGGYPQGITTGPDGNLWYTNPANRSVGRLTPSGSITEWTIPGAAAFVDPSEITSGPDGNIWFTERAGKKIGRITPTGVITEFAVSPSNIPDGITAGPDGNVWFVLLKDSSGGGAIGRITSSGVITEFPLPITRTESGSITTGPDGNLWFTAFYIDRCPHACSDVPHGFVGRITPDGATITTFSLGARLPRSIASGGDGNLWLTIDDYSDNFQIGRLTPDGVLTRFDLPPAIAAVSRCCRLNRITAGSDGNLWATGIGAGGPDKIFRIRPSGVISTFPLRDFNSSPHFDPFGITTGPDGNVWFTERNGKQIVRMSVGIDDGPINLIWRYTDTGFLGAWSLEDDSLKSEALLSPSVPPEWQLAGTGDVDGNGTADLVWRHTEAGHVSAWLMSGTSLTDTPVVALNVPLDWQIAGIGDLNRDGRSDIVWRNVQNGDVAVWFMNGANVTGIPLIASGVPLAWQIVGVGDLDGDGHDDLVWRQTQTGDVAAWFMDADHVKTIPVIGAGVPLAWQIVGLGDLDGDNRVDLLWRNTQNGDVAAWLMNGATIRSVPVIASGPLQWRIVKVADVNKDGKADLIWRRDAPSPDDLSVYGALVQGEVVVWLMDGARVLQASVLRYQTETISVYSVRRREVR